MLEHEYQIQKRMSTGAPSDLLKRLHCYAQTITFPDAIVDLSIQIAISVSFFFSPLRYYCLLLLFLSSIILVVRFELETQKKKNR